MLFASATFSYADEAPGDKCMSEPSIHNIIEMNVPSSNFKDITDPMAIKRAKDLYKAMPPTTGGDFPVDRLRFYLAPSGEVLVVFFERKISCHRFAIPAQLGNRIVTMIIGQQA